MGTFSENQTDSPNIGLVFEFSNWCKIQSNRNAKVTLKSQIDQTNYIASQKTEVLKTIEEDETNDSNGPIKLLDCRETLDLV